MTAAEIRQQLAGKEIFIIPYCHPDWAWTHTRAWHEARHVQVLEEVLEILRENESFRWYMDVYVTQLQPFLDRRPDLLAELRQRVQTGQIAVCGTYANVRPNMVGEETFIRNLALGRRLFAGQFPGVDLNVHADIVDVALGHPQMPQVLKLGGYTYYRAWRPQAALSERGVPYEWVWEGLDGSQVLCSRGCYGGLYDAALLPEGLADNWDTTLETLWQRELELIARHSPTGLLWLSQGMDDSRPLRDHHGRYVDVPSLITEWNRRETTSLRFATPVEFYQALEQRREELPVIAGTLDPCDVCYNAAWGGTQGLWQRRLTADRELVSAELWQAISPSPQGVAANFADLWQDLLLCCAHATQWLFQEDFDELQTLADRVIIEARRQRRQAQEALARRVPQTPQTAGIVFNSLPWEREELVKVLVTGPAGVPPRVRVQVAGAEPTATQIVNPMEWAGSIWEYEALARVQVPAGGYAALEWLAEETPAAEAQPETCFGHELLTADLQQGHLVNLHTPWGDYVAPEGLPWSGVRAFEVDPSGPLHVGPITGEADFAPTQWTVTEQGPLRWRQVARGQIGPHPATLTLSLPAGEARVQFDLEVDWQGGDGFLAALWPLSDEASLWADVPFGAEEKDLSAEAYGPLEGHRSNNIERLREGMFYARSWVSSHDGSRGVTHFNHQGDRYYLRPPRAGWVGHILLNTLRPVSEGWEKDINRQREGRGRHHFSWSLLWHEGDWRTSGIARRAAELNRPLEVRRPQGAPAPDQPAAASYLQLTPAHVLLSACREVGDLVEVRLWETHGEPATVILQLPFTPRSALAVDFNGNPQTEPVAEIAGQQVCCQLRPWQIATLHLRR